MQEYADFHLPVLLKGIFCGIKSKLNNPPTANCLL